MIKARKLDCGITLVTEQIPYVQSVSMGIWVKAGAVNENTDNTGISHLIEHMMFKGTEKRTAKEIASDVDRIGGQINAFTGKEATCYYIKTIASNEYEAAEILLDMITGSRFDETELEKEKRVVIEEMKMIQDTPDEDAHEKLIELVFQGTPFSKSIIGTAESVNGISSDDIRKYISEEYTKNSIFVAIAGNFNEEEMADVFEGKLSFLTPAKNIKSESFEPYRPQFITKVKDIEQSHICMAVPALSLNDERYFALSLLSFVLGGSMSSRLFQNIREDKGLCYSVYSVVTGYSTTGYFEIYAGTAHDKLTDVIEAVKNELNLLDKCGITEEELYTAKQQMKSAYIFGQENVNGRMFSIGKNMTVLGKIITPEEIVAKYDSVTLKDIDNVKNIITDLNNYSAVAASNTDVPLEKYIRG